MNTKLLALIVLIIPGFSSCAQSDGHQVSEKFAERKALAKNTQEKLKEVSGIAASYSNPGMMWVQNDSGNDAEVYLINKDLEIVLTCRLEGIENRDWEDITVGPGPVEGKSYVYVGDIGDNDGEHAEKFVYRFEEPAAKVGGNSIAVEDIDKITFRLSDSMKDTESLLIDHKTKNLYVISKREKPVTVYELAYPFKTSETLTAKKILTLPFGEVVSGATHEKTGDVLIKNYDHVFYWENTEKQSLPELLKREPVLLPYQRETQGEAITWAVDGSGFFTISERKKKKESWLYFYQATKK